MATYINITRPEMEAFLTEYREGKGIGQPGAFRQLRLEGYTQLVYGIVVEYFGCTMSLRIKTGINPDGNSRDVGDEAMHVELWWRDAENAIPVRVGTSKRLHRVIGWKSNLKDRLENWQDAAPMICAECRRPMKERKGPHGQFMGCMGWKKDRTGCNNVVQL